MVNRGLVLCLQNNIKTTEELSSKSGVALDVVASFINQNAKISTADLIKLCQFFKVSLPYLMCITESNNYPDLQLDYASI